MPHNSPPGQVLSSVPPSSEKRRSSKIGGCGGVLFQIFHGRRLFPRKALPAGRPKHGLINHTDDKLPIAKLLLIADENRIGPLTDTEDVLEIENGEHVSKEEPCEEEKVPTRTPSVVARLMGLDSMPSLESPFTETKQFEPYGKDMDCQFSFDESQERLATLEKTRKSSARVQSHSSLPMGRKTEFNASLPEKFTTQQNSSIWKDKAKDDVAKSKKYTKSPSLPPHYVDSSFPAAVCSSKKEETSNRSSMRMQKTARLLEAAARMLEASTPRTSQNRKQRLQNSTSRIKTSSLDVSRIQKGPSGREQVCMELRSQANQQLNASAVQAPSNQGDETKVPIGSRNTKSEMLSKRLSGSNAFTSESGRLQAGPVGRAEQVVGGGRGILRDTSPVKGKHGHRQLSTQPRANPSEKVKPDRRQQEETSRRLSQPTSFNEKFQRLKLLGTTHTRHPSPPKSFQDSCSGPCSSQASNSTVRASEGMLSTQPIRSRVSSNITPSKRLSSLSTKEEGTQPLQSVYSKAGVLLDEILSESQNPSTSDSSQFGEADSSIYCQDGSISSAIYTESHQRSSMESLLSSDPSLSEFTSSSEEGSSFPMGTSNMGPERVERAWQGDNSSSSEAKRASDTFLSKDSLQSKLESLSTELGDTASSHAPSDADSGACTSVHSYSGKNTAAILQELLTALSPSTASEETFKKPRVECSDSQELASCHSDSSEILESSKPCESSSLHQSMDCTSIADTEVEEIISQKSHDTLQIQVDHGVSLPHTEFADCEALMSTLSKLHHIDPKAIGLNVRTVKGHDEESIKPTVGSLIDPTPFYKLEEQAQQLDSGLSNYASLSVEEDADSMYRSDMESNFRNGYEDVAAAQNKRLVTDCINEAFNTLSKQLCGVSSSISGHSSASDVLSRVYKQIDEWKGMAITMNLDDMIEKEMNSTTRRWRNVGSESEEVAEVVESTILSGLMEEVLLELI